MSRLIDADALEREGWSLCRTFQKDKCTMIYEVKKPSDFPTIEERTGRWIYDENGMDWNIPAWICSECGGRNDMIPTSIKYIGTVLDARVVNPYIWAGSKFCPNCGVRMVDKK